MNKKQSSKKDLYLISTTEQKNINKKDGDRFRIAFKIESRSKTFFRPNSFARQWVIKSLRQVKNFFTGVLKQDALR